MIPTAEKTAKNTGVWKHYFLRYEVSGNIQ
jgi:hypothetical protein